MFLKRNQALIATLLLDRQNKLYINLYKVTHIVTFLALIAQVMSSANRNKFCILFRNNKINWPSVLPWKTLILIFILFDKYVVLLKAK